MIDTTSRRSLHHRHCRPLDLGTHVCIHTCTIDTRSRRSLHQHQLSITHTHTLSCEESRVSTTINPDTHPLFPTKLHTKSHVHDTIHHSRYLCSPTHSESPTTHVLHLGHSLTHGIDVYTFQTNRRGRGCSPTRHLFHTHDSPPILHTRLPSDQHTRLPSDQHTRLPSDQHPRLPSDQHQPCLDRTRYSRPGQSAIPPNAHQHIQRPTSPMSAELTPGTLVWVPGEDDKVWEQGKVLKAATMKGKLFAIVKTRTGRTVNSTHVYRCNSGTHADMTSMWYINEPSILHNLKNRSFHDEPYTFLGPVLVSVNPLKRVPDPPDLLGSSKALGTPHPYAIAEAAYQQLSFASRQGEDVVNQSVVVSGESGAGKTENSKMVLKHLVTRCGGEGLDKQLLCTNPILEAFGNAKTLRNPNSSRFGKFMKLHFDAKARSIAGASVETYLLELSRITRFEHGERNYHIFYQILAGLPGDQLKELGLSGAALRYLRSAKSRDAAQGPFDKPVPVTGSDKKNYAEVTTALAAIGIKKPTVYSLFELVAAVAHLGDLEFENESRSEGDVAVLAAASKAALGHLARILGADKKNLQRCFVEKELTVGGEPIVKLNDAGAAQQTCDSLAKALYSRTFNWVVEQISSKLSKDDDSGDHPLFIGVLDIFGFESFKRNGFEQLLINFTNESLQSTFNHQIFQSEQELYKREGLVLDEDDISRKNAMPTNTSCMNLFLGSVDENPVGLLQVIISEGQNISASTDAKMVQRMHKELENRNAQYIKVHPKDKHHMFTIGHYAGHVTYTVGNFLQKNADALPQEISQLVQKKCKSKFLQQVWDTESSAPSSSSAGRGKNTAGSTPRLGGGRKKQQSIISKFRNQIRLLMETIDATKCSFIRCVKPNAIMRRVGNAQDWFDERYVSIQVQCLSIPQTGLVFKSGYPTRIAYASLTESYLPILPSSAVKVWKSLGAKSETGFVAALFWAFGIPKEHYKLGVSKVFFKAGMLGALDEVLGAAREWGKSKSSKSGDKVGGFSKQEIVGRFRKYHARRRWRVAFAKLASANVFVKMHKRMASRGESALKIQTAFRGYLRARQYQDLRANTVLLQRFYRTTKDRVAREKLLAEEARNKERAKREAQRKAKALAEKKRKEATKALKEAKLRAKAEEEKLQEAETQKRYEDNLAKFNSMPFGGRDKVSPGGRGVGKSKLYQQYERRRKQAIDDAYNKLATKNVAAKSEEKHVSLSREKSDVQVIKFDANTAETYHEDENDEEDEGIDPSTKQMRNRFLKSSWDDIEDLRRVNSPAQKKPSSPFDQSLKMKKSINMIRRASMGAFHLKNEEARSFELDWSPMCGCIWKLAIRSQRNWRKRYVVFNPKYRTITYYRGTNSNTKPRGVFTINNEDHRVPPKLVLHSEPVKKRSWVMEIIGGRTDSITDYREDRSMMLSFETEAQRQEWYQVIQCFLDSLSDEEGEPEDESQIDETDLGDTELPLIDGLDENERKVLLEFAQLLVEHGISEKDGADLLAGAQREKELRAAEEDYGMQVVCPRDSCGQINNTSQGNACCVCNAQLLPVCATCGRNITDTVVTSHQKSYCSQDCVI